MRQEYMHRFDSLEDFLNKAQTPGLMDWSRGGRDKWAGGETIAQACKSTLTATAATPYMPQAQALLDKIDASFRDRDTLTWMPSVCGAYPIVAEALMGLPESMRTRMPVESDIAPINIYLEMGVSCGVRKEELVKRGIALAALIMRMSEMRPVQLKLFGAWELHTHNNNWIFFDIPMSSTPVSVAHVLSTIAHDSFMRTLNFGVCDWIARKVANRKIDFNESFGWAFGSPTGEADKRRAGVRDRFNLNPQDIVIQCGYLDDAQLMNSDPVAWVHAQLEKQRAVIEL